MHKRKMNSLLKNKKAQMFSIYLAGTVFLLMVISLSAFFNIKGKMESAIMPPTKLVDNYNEKSKIIFYSEQAAELASQKAFDSVAQMPVSGECSLVNINYPLLNDKCKPETEKIKNEFLNKFNESYAPLIKNYSSVKVNFISSSFEKNVLQINIENITMTASNDKGYVSYNASFVFNPSLEFNLSSVPALSDFEDIYLFSQKCRDKNMTKTKECLENSKNNFEKWNFMVSGTGNYLLLDFATKKNYFLSNGFSGIVFKFALEI